MDRLQKGKMGEEAACNFLINNGFSIVERNFRCKTGEVDLIASRNGGYYFIEVKTRWSDGYGNPLESVTYAKQRQVIKAARVYLAKKRLFDVECHLSAIGVDMAGDRPAIEFIEDAFEL